VAAGLTAVETASGVDVAVGVAAEVTVVEAEASVTGPLWQALSTAAARKMKPADPILKYLDQG
jgi:predicted ABC-type sugar transport system permease subunit